MFKSSVAYRLSDGTEFIGRGIQPDIEADLTAADVRKGKDAVLEKALDYLKKQNEA